MDLYVDLVDMFVSVVTSSDDRKLFMVLHVFKKTEKQTGLYCHTYFPWQPLQRKLHVCCFLIKPTATASVTLKMLHC